MSRSISRRTFAAGSIATILGGAAATSVPLREVMAQGGGVDLASLGLPTLDITMTDTGFEGMPEEIEAGRYLVNIAVHESLVEGGGGDFMSPPAGMTAQDVIDQLGLGGGPPPMASPEGMGTPETAPVAASPEAGAEGGEEGPPEAFMIPQFVYQSLWAGGAVGLGGTTAQAVIDLPAGEWLLLGDDPFGAQAPTIFTVTGEVPADVAEPEGDIMVSFIEFGITVEGALTAGDHLVRIENLGAQPHFIVAAKGPDGMTNEQLGAVLQSFFGGPATPEALPFDPDTELMLVLSTATQSMGVVQWVPVSLEAGTYAGVCYFPNAGEGLPHAAHGMHTVFTVE